jgi:sulfur carrier protein ThiS
MAPIKVTYEGKVKNLDFAGKKVEDVMKELGLSPQTILAKLNDEFVADDELLKGGDRLVLIRISSIG